MIFKEIDIRSKQELDAYFERVDYEACEYCFSTLYMWQHVYKTGYYIGEDFAVLVGEYEGDSFSILPLASKDKLPKVIDFVLKYFEKENISSENVLYQEDIDEGKAIVFVAHDAISIAIIKKTNQGWEWKRISPYFNATSNSGKSFTAMSTDIEMPNGEICTIALGRVYDPKVKKINLDDKCAIIKEVDGNTFWFMILGENKNLLDVKAYKDEGSIL